LRGKSLQKARARLKDIAEDFWDLKEFFEIF